MQRRDLLLFLGAATLAGTAGGQVPGPVKLLVGFPAGGAVDVVARQLGEALRTGGFTVVVENRPGAAGKLAIDALKAAPPDGQTLMVMPNSILAMEPGLHAPPRFRLGADIAPVSPVSANTQAFAVGAGVPVQSLAQFLDWARANPDRANFATPGQGTPFHFLGAELAAASGAPLRHVPYRGGAQLMPDVISGQVASTFSTTPNLLPFHQRGQLRILAVSGPQRLPALPDVPTFAEAGHPGVGEVEQFGVFAPGGTPPEVLEGLARAVAAAVQVPVLRQGLDKAGFDPVSASPSDYARRLAEESRRWEERIRRAGFKPNA